MGHCYKEMVAPSFTPGLLQIHEKPPLTYVKVTQKDARFLGAAWEPMSQLDAKQRGSFRKLSVLNPHRVREPRTTGSNGSK